MPTCSWDHNCTSVEWVIAWMCDRCDITETLEVCAAHYTSVISQAASRWACPDCSGTVSYVAQQIHGDVETEAIN